MGGQVGWGGLGRVGAGAGGGGGVGGEQAPWRVGASGWVEVVAVGGGDGAGAVLTSMVSSKSFSTASQFWSSPRLVTNVRSATVRWEGLIPAVYFRTYGRGIGPECYQAAGGDEG